MNLTAISSNIRFENPQDGINSWSERKFQLASLWLDQGPHIIMTQEGRKNQLYDLKKLLPTLDLADQHRSWIEERMYPCLFFNPQELELITSGDFWLSLTPHEAGSSSFGSAFPRLCTWALFEKKAQRRRFYVFNTHLDHLNEATRVEQAKVLLGEMLKINSLCFPMILGGDFNTNPLSQVHQILTQNILQLQDHFEHFFQTQKSTFHNFKGSDFDGERIDWVLHHPHLKMNLIKVLTDHQADRYPSDHYPVLARFNFI